MVKINRIKETISHLISPSGEYLGEIRSSVELNDVRMQIAKEKAEGYSIKFNDIDIIISPNGDLSRWPRGFYDTQQKQFAELVKIRRNEITPT